MCGRGADNYEVVYRGKNKVLLWPQLSKECPGFVPGNLGREDE